MGQSTQLQARASDADGDSLSYSWSQTSPASPQGSFSSTSSDSPTWTAPTVNETTPFTLSVTVSDGKGGNTTATLTLYAKTSSDPSFIAEVSPLLSRDCAGCHSGAAPPGQLTLEASKAYAALVNVLSLVSCTTLFRVKPGEPASSDLLLKMEGTSCGGRMPAGDTGYYDRVPEELALVRAWVQAGAPNN